MDVPVVNLTPQIEATRQQWQQNLDEMFRRGQYILGPHTASFEREFAAAIDARFAVGVGSGTSAIELCLRHAEITHPSHRVLTSALTAPFTGIAILQAGATPQFADIDPDTLLIDPADAAARVSPDTAAIVPVHLYGQPLPLDRFAQLAAKRGLVMIQDACQAHGASCHGREPFTSFSPYVAYSFYPTKNLGCLGDGGAIATSDPEVDSALRLLRDGGRDGDQLSRVPGINSRLDEMQACYLRAFLPHLAEWNGLRGRFAALYDKCLAGCPGIRPIKRHTCSVNHLYIVRADRRDDLRQHLSRHGIGTGIHYPVPLHLHPAFADAGLRKGDLPHAEKACAEILSLPLWPYLEPSAVERVAAAIRSFYS